MKRKLPVLTTRWTSVLRNNTSGLRELRASFIYAETLLVFPKELCFLKRASFFFPRCAMKS